MSAINPGLAAPSLRRLPFTIRLAPQFVNRLLSRRQLSASSPDGAHGLLFGIADENLVVVQAFRSFAALGERDAPESELFKGLLASVHNDPEVSPLELVGWYAVRTNGGLLQNDIEFHNLHFQRPNELALILKPEGETCALMELYCRSADSMLSSEGHRWGAVRQTLGSPLVGPVEVAMRSKVQDDFFLRTYQASREEEEEEGAPGWKNIIQSNTKRALGWLAEGRKERTPQNAGASQPLSQPVKPPALREQIPSNLSANSASRQLSGAAREHGQSPPLPAARKGSTNLPAPQREKGAAASLQSIHAGAPPGVPALIPEAPRRRSIPWISSVLVFATAAGLTFGLVYSYGLSSGNYMPGFLKSFFPAPGLGLRLESQGDRLLLSWNRHHPAVRNSKGGLLQIDDGPKHRQVVLDATQVLNGSVLYRPISDDVTFRLEVESIQDGKVSETMRVLDAAKPGTLDVSTPSAVTAAPPADRTVAPAGQPDGGMAGRTAAGQVPYTRIPASTTVVSRRAGGATANGPVVNAPPPARSGTSAGNTQTAPPPHVPLNMPVKKAETPGQVNFDVLPGTPAPAENGGPTASANSGATSNPTATTTETARNAPPLEANVTPAPVTGKQNPEKQIQGKPSAEKQKPLSASSSEPLPNTAALKTQPPQSAIVNYRPPRPLRQVVPNTSPLSPAILAGAGRVEVVLKVDATGHVTEAHIVNGAKKVNPLVAGVSVLAAKQWIFQPATLSGRPVPSEHSVVFQFQTPR